MNHDGILTTASRMRLLGVLLLCCAILASQTLHIAAQDDNSTGTLSSTGTSSSTGGPPPPGCLTLPPTSICASFYPAGSFISTSFACLEDAEAYLKTAPLVWSSLRILTTPPPESNVTQSTCSRDFAQLMCLAVYRPCNAQVSRGFCQATLGSPEGSGSCPVSIQQGFLAAVIPNFAATFNCTGSPLFHPLGLGPMLNQTDSSHPILVPEDTCAPLSSTSICRGVIDYDVFIPAYLFGDQSKIEAQIVKSFTSAMLLANVASGCLTSLSKMLCGMVYTRCDKDAFIQSVSSNPYLPGDSPVRVILPALKLPFPRLPCNSLCQDVQDQCPLLLASNAALAQQANCSGVGLILKPVATCNGGYQPNTAGPNFPNTSATLGVLGLGVLKIPIVSQCNTFAPISGNQSMLVSPASLLTCPFPLVRSASPEDRNAILGGVCATPCPSPLFTREEWKSGDRFFIALTVSSFFSSLVIWLTWIIFPIKRKQTNTLMFNFIVWFLSFVNLIMILNTDGHPSQISCKNDSEYKEQSDGQMCVFQAMSFFYFTLAGVAFWFASSFDLFLKIVLNKKFASNEQERLNRIYVILGWSIPFLFMIIALGLQAFGGALGTPWCFMSVKNPISYDWGLFFYPIMFVLIGGSICMFSIMWKMAKTALSAGAKKGQIVKSQVRPFLFIFIFIWIFVFIFGYRVRLYFKQETYTDSAQEWIKCLITTLGDLEFCGEKPAQTVEVGLWFMIMLSVSGQGLMNSIIFGFQWQNVQLWVAFFRGRGVNGNGVISAQTDETHSRSGQSGQSTKKGRRQASKGNLMVDVKDDGTTAKPRVHVSIPMTETPSNKQRIAGNTTTETPHTTNRSVDHQALFIERDSTAPSSMNLPSPQHGMSSNPVSPSGSRPDTPESAVGSPPRGADRKLFDMHEEDMVDEMDGVPPPPPRATIVGSNVIRPSVTLGRPLTRPLTRHSSAAASDVTTPIVSEEMKDHSQQNTINNTNNTSNRSSVVDSPNTQEGLQSPSAAGASVGDTPASPTAVNQYPSVAEVQSEPAPAETPAAAAPPASATASASASATAEVQNNPSVPDHHSFDDEDHSGPPSSL